MEKFKLYLVLINFYIIFFMIIFSSLCKKETSKEAYLESVLEVEAEVDIKKIENLIGIQFQILKTKTIGQMPLHKFYWISLQERVDHQKIKELANAIIKESIASELKTYHSFTIHFFLEEKLKDTLEKSECYARATFLPEGSWLKVGRASIDDYKNYKLTCTFYE